jgi:hypothetical protein
MELYAAVQPLVMTIQGYQDAYGEDDPEELALMQIQDKEVAVQINDVLKDLYDLETNYAEPQDGEGVAEEIGLQEELHELRQIAAAFQGRTTDDYYEGRAQAGMRFNHLINHSDTDGYYVPVEFMQAFFVEETSIGSSVSLLAELDVLGPVLGDLYPEEVAKALLTSDEEERAPLTGPVGIWHSLSRLCRSSIELDMPIHFG